MGWLDAIIDQPPPQQDQGGGWLDTMVGNDVSTPPAPHPDPLPLRPQLRQPDSLYRQPAPEPGQILGQNYGVMPSASAAAGNLSQFASRTLPGQTPPIDLPTLPQMGTAVGSDLANAGRGIGAQVKGTGASIGEQYVARQPNTQDMADLHNLLSGEYDVPEMGITPAEKNAEFVRSQKDRDDAALQAGQAFGAIKNPVLKTVAPMALPVGAPIVGGLLGGPPGAVAGGVLTGEMAGAQTYDTTERTLRTEHPEIPADQRRSTAGLAGAGTNLATIGTSVIPFGRARGAIEPFVQSGLRSVGFHFSSAIPEALATGKPLESRDLLTAFGTGLLFHGAVEAIHAITGSPAKPDVIRQLATAKTPEAIQATVKEVRQETKSRDMNDAAAPLDTAIGDESAIHAQEAQLDRLDPQLTDAARETMSFRDLRDRASQLNIDPKQTRPKLIAAIAAAEARQNSPPVEPRAAIELPMVSPEVAQNAAPELQPQPVAEPAKPAEAPVALPEEASPESQSVPSIFSENSAERASRILDPKSRLGVNEQVWASNDRDLAIGQGDNRGVVIEFDPAKARTVERTGKPGLALTGKKEFSVLGQSAELADAVRSVTVDPKLATGPFSGRLGIILKRRGFELRTNKDGTITYLPKEEAPPESLPAPKSSAQSAVTDKPFGLGPSTPSATDPVFEYGTDKVPSVGIKNASVDKERATRGLEPAMKVAKRDFGEVWDGAMKRIEEHPSAQTDLIDELRAKPRALTDQEDALLLHRQIELQNEYAGEAQALTQAQAANDEAGIAEHRARTAVLSDQLLDIYNIGKASGTETGRGLNARKLMARDDFTLAAMEVRKRAANDGKPLTEEQASRLKIDHERISEAQRKLDQHTRDAEAAEQKRLTQQIAILDRKIKAGDISTKGRKQGANSKIVNELKTRRDALQDQLDAMRGDTTRLKSFKTRAMGRVDQFGDKIGAGDFSKDQRRELKLDEQGLTLKAQLERYKQMFEDGVLRDRLKNRTPLEKVQDTFVKWSRLSILSSPITIAKLTSAAAERLAFTPIEEAIGAGYSKAFPRLAANSAGEGGISTRAEAKAITEGFTTGMRDAAQVLKTGKSNLDVLYGKHSGMPPEMLDFIGNLHGALKAPVKRAAFARAFQKGIEEAMIAGLDPHDPLVQTRVANTAYKAANRSIFMQDNIIANKISIFLSKVTDKATGKATPASVAIHTVGKTLLPVVKVPTNIVAETMDYALGTVTGGARLAKAYHAGIDTVSPEAKAVILRSLKKGTIGAAVMALGYFGADQVGGYYQPGKKRAGEDVKFGRVRIFGADVPSYLVHNPLLECLQIGATIRRVAESRLRKKDGEDQGIPAGVVAAAVGVIEEVPLVRETADVQGLLNPYTRGKAAKELVKSRIIPKGTTDVAGYLGYDGNSH